MKKAIIILAAMFLLCASFVVANFGPLGTIVQVGEDINYGNSPKNMTVNIFYNCTGIRTLNITFPPGFYLHFTGGTCSLINNSLASCTFQNTSAFDEGSYTFEGSSSLDNYSVVQLINSLSNTTDCSTNSISIVRVPDDGIFQTLVEYGRGRGNYFYSTLGGAGSGHTGVGCPYVPNNTMFELNFLHKVFNIRQYFNNHSLVAQNATFTCSYPNRTIVRTHLGTSISKGATGTTVSYYIDEIEGSWERMAYLGMDFDSSEQQVGENLTISCSNIQYTLPGLGNVTVFVNNLTFNLEVRDPYPFSATASTTSTIGNGTQEVVITYTITNNEIYSIDDAIIEIQAPDHATFIGTRGELWGTALDQYRIEKAQLTPNQTETIILVTRFDTTTAGPLTNLNLTNGIKIKYTTCWEKNAYNPTEYIQNLNNIGTATVNMGIPSQITGIIDTLEALYNLSIQINTTVTEINSTVNQIEILVDVINATTNETNYIVKQLNQTIYDISNKTSIILNNTNQIINNTDDIKELIDCDNVSDSPICSSLDSMNNTIVYLQNITIELNQTLSNFSVNLTVNLSDQNLSMNVTPNLTNVMLIIEDIRAELNCTNVTGEPNASICKRLIRIENNTQIINSTVIDINNLINYFNNTVFGNITLQQIYDQISNITVDTSELLAEIRKIREFDEELVFLVTDAFGMANEARTAAANGNLSDAAEKLRLANARLNEATIKLAQSRGDAEKELYEGDLPLPTVMWILGIILVALVTVYLFQKVPEDDEPGERY